MVNAGSNASSFFSGTESKKLFGEMTDDLPEQVEFFSYVSYVISLRFSFLFWNTKILFRFAATIMNCEIGLIGNGSAL